MKTKELFSTSFRISAAIFFLFLVMSSSIPAKMSIMSNLHFTCTISDSLFTPNSQAGWDVFPGTVFLNQTEDSIEFEAVLSRQVPDSNSWALPSELGTINSAFRPDTGRTISFKEPNRSWNVTIEPDGKCFLNLLDGPDPTGAPIVLPLRIKFRK